MGELVFPGGKGWGTEQSYPNRKGSGEVQGSFPMLWGKDQRSQPHGAGAGVDVTEVLAILVHSAQRAR